MAQFDSLIIFPLLWSFVFILFFYYNTSITFLIPDFFGAKKFRKKKLNSYNFFKLFKTKSNISINNKDLYTILY